MDGMDHGMDTVQGLIEIPIPGTEWVHSVLWPL